MFKENEIQYHRRGCLPGFVMSYSLIEYLQNSDRSILLCDVYLVHETLSRANGLDKLNSLGVILV